VEISVQILLSTYNGEKYLKEQIESILNQSYSGWQLLIKDDGSTDKTLEIITGYCTLYPEKVKQVFVKEGGSSTKSFMAMLPLVTANYCMFADQDDVWVANKIQLSIDKIKEIEKINSPALVYTDMQVGDENLQETHPSFLAQHKLNPSWVYKKENVFVQSMSAGCTMLFTKSLIVRLNPIDAELFQHDHWILMHAAAYGAIGFISEKTVLYRQHGANSVGSHGVSKGYFASKLLELNKIFSRWKYLKTVFKPSPSFFSLAFYKLTLNFRRLF